MSDDRQKLERIIECVERVQEYLKDGKENFLTDYKTQDAVIRNCQIIGEAVKGLSNELRQNTKDIDWRSPARFRDKITHDYFDVDLERVWEVCEGELLIFTKQVRTILKRHFSQVKSKPGKSILAEKLREEDK